MGSKKQIVAPTSEVVSQGFGGPDRKSRRGTAASVEWGLKSLDKPLCWGTLRLLRGTVVMVKIRVDRSQMKTLGSERIT